jgi:hypothetical protein
LSYIGIAVEQQAARLTFKVFNMARSRKTSKQANGVARPKSGAVSEVFGHVDSLVRGLGKDRTVITIAWAVASLGSFASGWQGAICVQIVFGVIFFIFRKTGLIED